MNATMCCPGRHKEGHECLTDEVAGSRPSSQIRAAFNLDGQPVSQGRVDFNDDATFASGNRTDTHAPRTVAPHRIRVNTSAHFVPHSVAMDRMGPFLKASREALALTQKEVGALVGLSRQRVSQYETGERTWPGPEIVNAFARALDVPAAEIMRAAGVAIPAVRDERLAWAVAQMDQDGVEQLADIAFALLPRHRRPLQAEVLQAETPQLPAASGFREGDGDYRA